MFTHFFHIYSLQLFFGIGIPTIFTIKIIFYSIHLVGVCMYVNMNEMKMIWNIFYKSGPPASSFKGKLWEFGVTFFNQLSKIDEAKCHYLFCYRPSCWDMANFAKLRPSSSSAGMSEALISISPDRLHLPPPGKVKINQSCSKWREITRKLVENNFWIFSPPPKKTHGM